MKQKLEEQILTFWFQSPSDPHYGQPRQVWFQQNKAFDREIRERFLPVYKKAYSGELDSLQKTPLGTLALILLLDQFPRNLFRGKAQAFFSDEQALKIAKQAIIKSFDKDLPLTVMRSFLYLPFEHSETLEDQTESMRLYTELGDSGFLEFAQRHQETIKKFGRFPGRNKALGRKSTQEECLFLGKNPMGF